MKRLELTKLLLALISLIALTIIPSCNSIVDSSGNSSSSNSIQDPSSSYVNYEGNLDSSSRTIRPLSGAGWKFRKQDVQDAKRIDYDDSSWGNVTIPHTWNNLDGQDGGGNYVRTASWYRKKINITQEEYVGKKHYLEFFGVNMQAEVYVNQVSVGLHKGGYTAFRFDVTAQLHVGENLIAIWVSNVKTQDIAPLGADFNFYGGIYREVNLVSVSEVHVDALNYGSSGLKLTTTDVSREHATLTISSNVINDSNSAKTVTIKATLKEPDKFEDIHQIINPDFNPLDMATGQIINVVSENLTIPAGEKYLFDKRIIVDNPKLWNGRSYPFRYQVNLEIVENDKTIDDISSYVGFRFFEVTKSGGFYLNGVSYPLRGVSRHQDWKNKGNAIGKNEHDIDFSLIYELGVSSIRLAHYPHSNYFYELCDKYGIVVWAEIPFVNHVGTAANFLEVTKTQLIELIRQQYNRPSICIWGLQNEVEYSYNSFMIRIMKVLNDTAHEEDPTRKTAQATHHMNAKYWDADLLAWNTYPGWYSGTTIKANMDDYEKNYSMPTGILMSI